MFRAVSVKTLIALLHMLHVHPSGVVTVPAEVSISIVGLLPVSVLLSLCDEIQ